MRFEQTRVMRTVTYTVTDAPDQPVRYGRSGIIFRPDTVMVTVESGEILSVRARGYRALKDGTLGQARHEVLYYRSEPVPEWLSDIVKAARA